MGNWVYCWIVSITILLVWWMLISVTNKLAEAWKTGLDNLNDASLEPAYIGGLVLFFMIISFFITILIHSSGGY